MIKNKILKALKIASFGGIVVVVVVVLSIKCLRGGELGPYPHPFVPIISARRVFRQGGEKWLRNLSYYIGQ